MKKSIMICYCLRKNLNGLKKDLITRYLLLNKSVLMSVTLITDYFNHLAY